jgi:hypothetical protein
VYKPYLYGVVTGDVVECDGIYTGEGPRVVGGNAELEVYTVLYVYDLADSNEAAGIEEGVCV